MLGKFILEEILVGLAVVLAFWFCVFGVRRIAEGLTPPQFTFDDLLDWADEIETSAEQLQKGYDWRIAQWSAFASAVLTAMLAFLSACVVELFKGTMLWRHVAAIMMGGTAASIGLYLVSQVRIAKLRKEFLDQYTLVAHLH
jgi:hypothetical protein